MIKKISVILFFVTLFDLTLFAQWEPDMRLTNDPDFSITTFNNARALAVSTNALNVVWMDYRDGNYEIYYKRSTNSGLNWSTDSRLTTDIAFSSVPGIASNGLEVHVIWCDDRDGNKEIYYKNSTNEGIAWGNDIRLTNNASISESPCISVSGANVYIVWHDNRNGNREIFFKRSTDNGLTWSSDIRLSNNLPEESVYPCLSVVGQTLHAIWFGWYANLGHYNIFYKKSLDGGVTWLPDTILCSNIADARYPCISTSGQNLSIVWQYYLSGGNTDIYYVGSTNGGISWGPETRLTNNPSFSEYPAVCISSQNIHLVWEDYRDGNWEIYYKLSSDGGISWSTDLNLTNSPSGSEHPSILNVGQAINLVWTDHRDGNYEIYYKLNPTGNLTGLQNLGNEIPKDYKLEQNFPNPFNPLTKIQFAIPQQGLTSLKILDVTGRILKTVFENEELSPGTYEKTFDGSDIASGIYFYSLFANGNLMKTRKMILLK